MSSKRHDIAFVSSGRRIEATEGQNLFQVLARAGVQLRSECGGQGVCGKCLVAIQEVPEGLRHGAIAMDVGSRPSRQAFHQACQWVVQSDLAIEIPFGSLAPAEVITKPPFLRTYGVARTAAARALTRGPYGLAIDLGTTTIALFLCDLGQGKVLASGSVRNPQLVFGDDVMSRISAVAFDRANLARMQELVVAAVNQSVASLAEQCGIETQGIVKAVVVGNSCMIHLFLRVDPSAIGTYPYRPTFTDARRLAAADIGLVELHAEAQVHTLPLISGFLGCDVVAAVMASDLDLRGNDTLMLDVGTNGEVILNVRGELSAASCATGPALEGAAISHGMHAVSGAVDGIRIDPVDGTVGYSLIQNNPERPRKASEICGSGIVSAIAVLFRAGVLLKSGRFNLQSHHPNLRCHSEGAEEFVLVPAGETWAGGEITLTQKDVRAVQFAKAAVFSGIALLCREAGSALPGRVLMTGAFGTFLNKEDAMTIGMLPRLGEKTVKTVGNAAGEGAIFALLHADAAERAEKIAGRTRVVDLGSHPDFQEVFLNALGFPEP